MRLTILLLVWLVAMLCSVSTGHPFDQTQPGDIDKLETIRNWAKEFWERFIDDSHAVEIYTRGNKLGFQAPYLCQQIVGAMPMLWIMNLDAQFAQAKRWLEQSITFDNITPYNYSSNIMAGLLSSYALTKDPLFLNKSLEYAKIINPLYNSSTGILNWFVNPPDKRWNWTFQKHFWSWAQSVENVYLTKLTGDPTYMERNTKARAFLDDLETTQDLFYTSYDYARQVPASSISSLSHMKNLLQNLVELYRQSDGKDADALSIYSELWDSILQNNMIAKSKGDQTYVRSWNTTSNSYGHRMEISECSLGGTLALGARALKRERMKYPRADYNSKMVQEKRIQRHWRWSQALADTCRNATKGAEYELTPQMMYFTKTEEAAARNDTAPVCLTSYLPRTFLIMSRLSINHEYRTWQWELARATRKYMKTYFVYPDPVGAMATYQFFYLTFLNDTNEPMLDRWVFTSTNQPLPILG